MAGARANLMQLPCQPLISREIQPYLWYNYVEPADNRWLLYKENGETEENLK